MCMAKTCGKCKAKAKVEALLAKIPGAKTADKLPKPMPKKKGR